MGANMTQPMSPLFDRAGYAILTEAVYLNQGSLGLIGEAAAVAMHRTLDDVFRHGNVHMSDEQEAGFLDTLRDVAGRLLGADTRRIAILSSASELLSQIPLMLRPPRGSRVIAVSSDFPAITRPWLRLVAEDEDFHLTFVDDDPASDLTNDLIAAIDDQTFLVAVGHVQYATGTMIDVPRLRAAARKVGAWLLVDATQSAGALPVGATSRDADVVVSSGYKWLGGHGGVAIGAIGHALDEATPAMPGWMGAPDPFAFDATRLLLAEDAHRYTQSTMSYVSVAGLTAAIRELLEVGVEAIERHAAQLGQLLVAAAGSHGWQPFRQLDDAGASPHIISLAHPGADPADVSARLRAANIVCSIRDRRIRVSIAPYNDETDIESLSNALAM